MKRKLLLICVCLFGAVGSWAYTSVVPQVGRTYYLYNMGTGKYWHRASDTYEVVDDIANATPITIESGNKLAYVYEGTTYRIHHDDGTQKPWQTEGVNFTFEGSATDTWGYQLKSKHNDHDRWMCPDGTFQQKGKYYNRDWQFISVYEVSSGTAAECASTAEASYVTAANGWERVSNNTVLDESVNDYFFAIVCANYPGIMVNMANGAAGQQAGDAYTSSKSMWYSNATNPSTNNSFLWMIEKNTTSGYEGYTFRNTTYPSLTIQAEWDASHYTHTHDQANPCQWNSYELAQTGGVYTIKTLANGGTNYLGLWTPSNDYTNGQELAGNKGESEKGQFLIYRIAKDNLDMTSRITNPTFDSNNSGWTATGGFSNNQIANNKGGDFTVPFWENWDGTAKANKMYQNLTNLPNGFYKVKIAAFVNNLAENNSSQYVFANNDKTYLVTTGPKFYEVWTEVTDNTLSIGLEQTTATTNWMGIDNVSLTYSSSLPESLTPITGKMNAAVEAAQTSAVEAYAASQTVANINAAMKAKAAAEVSKAAYAVLLSTINDANTLYNSGANVGSGVFQIPTDDGTTFSSAITTAQDIYDTASATDEEVLSASSTLQTAITTYEGVTLNAPTVGTRYKLTLADRGTLTYQTASTEGGYGLPFKDAGDYMAQTFTFTQVSGNTYTMSFEDLDGNTRYICTRAQYGEGGTGTAGIRSFVEGAGGKTALQITIQATSTANVFYMLNTECDNKKLGSNGGDFYTDDTYTSWSIAEAAQASVAVAVSAGKWATRIFPFAPGTIDGITFYSCNAVDGDKVTITEEATPAANTPYILKANKAVDTSVSGWGTANGTSYEVGYLTGVYNTQSIAASVEPTETVDGAYRYVLQTQDELQAFYKVDDAFTATAYRAYLTVPVAKTGGGVKAFYFDFGDADGINTVQGSGFKVQDSEIYNLAGQKMSKLQRGVNIVNGKKVLVK